MAVTRIIAYASGSERERSRAFYTSVLGLQAAMEDPVLALVSPGNPTAQVLIAPPGMDTPAPAFGVDVGTPEAVDAAHAAAVRQGLRILRPVADEPWGVRRFFVEDPGGTVVNVLAHLPEQGGER